MAEFTHEYSQYPDKLMTKRTFKDVDDSIAMKVSEIQDLRRSGNYTKAAQRINELNIKDYNFSASDVNWLIEEIRNTQIYAKQKRQNIYNTEDCPSDTAVTYDVWIGGN